LTLSVEGMEWFKGGQSGVAMAQGQGQRIEAHN